FLLKFKSKMNKINILKNNKSIVELYSWGSGWSGQLGLGKNIIEQYIPRKVEFANDETLQSNDKVKTGSYHALLIKGNKFYSWGQNNFGQLGISDLNDRFTPTLNNNIANKDNNIKILDGECGAFHSILSAYDSSKDIYKTYSFGWNQRMQCGQEGNEGIISTPTEIQFLKNQKIKSISCGFDYSVVVTEEDNGMFLFGMNDRGQCILDGDSSSSNPIQKPKLVKEFNNIKIKKVSSGWGHTLVLSEDGQLFSWGSNQHGQCGTGVKNQYSPISKIELPNSQLKVLDISCGSCASAAILSDNRVYIWGSGGDGKLGLGERKDDLLKPTLLDTLNDKVSQISFGSDHCVALPLQNNPTSFYGWGFGQHGCLGFDSTIDKLKVFSTPEVNHFFDSSNNSNNFKSIISIQSSLDTTFALVEKNI
ncbi:hypothetical protein DICPUDRAFT_33948, partial [Dictyostelium purpureum]